MRYFKTLNLKSLCISFFIMLAATATAHAAVCGNNAAGYDRWLKDFKKEARAKGLSARALNALNKLTYDKRVIRLDRNQKRGKRLSFNSYAAKRITKSRLTKGRGLLRKHARLLSGIERRYGVPGPVIVAIWGLETDYGRNRGNMRAIRSLASLAYDCRRSAFFTNELYAALTIIDRGYMRAEDMRGAWAGELGQTQFLASSYLKFAVDYNRDGRRDLVRSIPDALASTANYLRAFGWRSGAAYGPGTANARVFAHWNRSTNYQKTIALFASKLAGR